MATSEKSAKVVGNTRRKFKQVEKEIQNAVCEYLQLKGYFFWRSNNVPAITRRGDKWMFRALPKYTPRGIPDIMLVDDSKFYGIEIKKPGAKLRPEQKVFMENLQKNGANYFIITSIEEARALF